MAAVPFDGEVPSIAISLAKVLGLADSEGNFDPSVFDSGGDGFMDRLAGLFGDDLRVEALLDLIGTLMESTTRGEATTSPMTRKETSTSSTRPESRGFLPTAVGESVSPALQRVSAGKGQLRLPRTVTSILERTPIQRAVSFG